MEYLVSGELYRKMPAEEQPTGTTTSSRSIPAARSLTQHGADEKQTLAKVRTLYGKITHTWVEGRAYPEGPAKLFWAVTGQAPFLAPADSKLPPESRRP